MNEKMIELAVELTKVAMSTSSTVWVSSPDQVEKFLDVQARKLDQLYSKGPSRE